MKRSLGLPVLASFGQAITGPVVLLGPAGAICEGAFQQGAMRQQFRAVKWYRAQDLKLYDGRRTSEAHYRWFVFWTGADAKAILAKRNNSSSVMYQSGYLIAKHTANQGPASYHQ